jgi:hypothetical protein
MAHGHYRVSGKLATVMVHVTVDPADAVCTDERCARQCSDLGNHFLPSGDHVLPDFAQRLASRLDRPQPAQGRHAASSKPRCSHPLSAGPLRTPGTENARTAGRKQTILAPSQETRGADEEAFNLSRAVLEKLQAHRNLDFLSRPYAYLSHIREPSVLADAIALLTVSGDR